MSMFANHMDNYDGIMDHDVSIIISHYRLDQII